MSIRMRDDEYQVMYQLCNTYEDGIFTFSDAVSRQIPLHRGTLARLRNSGHISPLDPEGNVKKRSMLGRNVNGKKQKPKWKITDEGWTAITRSKKYASEIPGAPV